MPDDSQPRMTDEQRYLFDLQGYLVLPGVLPAAQIAEMQVQLTEFGPKEPQNHSEQSRFHHFFNFGPLWRGLIDHPAILPVLCDLLGPKFRLDHAYGMAMRAGAQRGGESLHHQAGMFSHGCYYVTHRDRMHNGLIVVSWAITDAPAGGGGFCCIPGSHKALYPTPPGMYATQDNPLVRQVPMNAGDVVVFTESLTHGTQPWTSRDHERRAVLLKYCPAYMSWTTWTMDPEKYPGLTARQKLILAGPGVYPREPVPPDQAVTS